MPSTLRQKACLACASSKRRCDKQLPECQRCLDRDVDCAYPQRKRRLRSTITDEGTMTPSYVEPNHNEVQEEVGSDVQVYGDALDFTTWDELVSANLGVTLPDEWVADVLGSQADSSNLALEPYHNETDPGPKSVLPWFLQESTWTMQRTPHEPEGPVDIDLHLFIRTVEDMLTAWATNGHNGFIHRRLYQYNMPTCVQDAFTTLVAYTNCNPAVKDTVLQIAQDRLSMIVLQDPPTTSDRQGISDHLARVQALFVYEFIGLFNVSRGSLRLRMIAEQHLPTLRNWLAQMLEAVKLYKGEDLSLYSRTIGWADNDFDREYHTSSELWKTWLLIESVRRIQIIINAVANSYQAMTLGWAQCTGSVMLTISSGFWEAGSALEWSDLACRKSPLLVAPLRPGPLMSQYPAEELDEFVRTFWVLILGPEKMQSWLSRSSRSSPRKSGVTV
ncbi:hypothetical protein LTR84_008171 [Exophiala bonariae]|uniref:Zn(2)-C6 fungal-type domain-containing protein n=1 Tax=Exophiala bonariae TaxID=1690606 RepID=A0AAV9N0L5_9EURO|nr:hypothetical protein LTR84_008171 [Exophiala bonariae]